MEVSKMIELLREIHEALTKDGFAVFFPVFLTLDQAKAELADYIKQESDLPSFEAEWVSQSWGIGGDDFSGDIIYQYKDIFIKVSFS